ncbi:Cell division cycle 5-like protein [Nymphaea thermarum]|nr:Cell division cycle 5-like protein [Nymphaea thermarum]
MIKGGVWKNTEDEILKAAVMKYGKNQWARISSLLVRKSAKQCKARWYEWLDPSIKKTEWTREEDEKLLHLAKLMPTQWRTIAPIVGRTPSQCLERYEKLLDAACLKDETYEPSDDPRKLRPGEIDPNPESKPARPDPVDMDEDEKEMLSEARARLANTRGKKAKRKAREKQLEEARRLASLQKRRELKAAGIDVRHRKRKRKGIDYNAEIPFEKRPPPGFFDVADEDRPVEHIKFPTTIEELEGKRRVDVEAQLRKQDIAKNKILQRQDAPAAIMQANKLNDPEAVRKRSKLMLPAPQISDQELEEIAKMGYASDLVSGGAEGMEGGNVVTRALLANYGQTPRQGMTPLRTPQRTPGGKADAIMMEAENLARLRESQTPLLGGDNPELHPSDFSGVTPKKREIQTPNPMATPMMTPGATGLTPRIGMTPSRDGYSYGMTPKGTPLRDELHINEDIGMTDSAKLELHRQAELRKNLRSGLVNLPQPKNEYQIVVQELPEEGEEVVEKIEEDMSDKIAREKAEEEARQEALLRKRSKVLQRELPRPPKSAVKLIKDSLVSGDKSSFVPTTPVEHADEMIREELLKLLEHDNAKYPLDKNVETMKKKGNKGVSSGRSAGSIPEIEDFEEDELKEANALIEQEISFLRVAMGHENASVDDFSEAHGSCQDDLMYFPSRDTYGLASVANISDKLLALQNEFENVKNWMEDETKKAVRLEKKIKILTDGYQMRAGNLWPQIESAFKQMDTAGTELECFHTLQKQEQLAASSRIECLQKEVNIQKDLERHLQNKYGKLVNKLDRMRRTFDDYKMQLQMLEEIEAKKRAAEESNSCPDQTENTNQEEAVVVHGLEANALSSTNSEDTMVADGSLNENVVPNSNQTAVIDSLVNGTPGTADPERASSVDNSSTDASVVEAAFANGTSHVQASAEQMLAVSQVEVSQNADSAEQINPSLAPKPVTPMDVELTSDVIPSREDETVVMDHTKSDPSLDQSVVNQDEHGNGTTVSAEGGIENMDIDSNKHVSANLADGDVPHLAGTAKANSTGEAVQIDKTTVPVEHNLESANEE